MPAPAGRAGSDRPSLADLAVPIIGAPMAGGPSTPELVHAVERAGGAGFLASGYGSADALLEQVRRVRELGARRFGVNLFVPDALPADLDAARAYRDELAPLAAELGIDELGTPRQDDSGFDAKVAALLADPVPVVSFTFGLPAPGTFRRFRDVGTAVWATVTSTDDAVTAVEAGADVLVVQGPEAGGHRSTFAVADTPGDVPLGELLRAVRRAVELPLIAAGGLTTGQDVARALEVADAAQVGTALLDADEAGTSPGHRAALRDPALTTTAVTRAFTGRPARSLVNELVRRYDAVAPPAYPALNHVTWPIRQAGGAAGDTRFIPLWTGQGWREAPSGPAQRIVADLWAAAETAARGGGAASSGRMQR
ncbi:NAD(P)H-dependent flavin oxidoreductase [Georgenia sp. Z1491]|uniref:NAD(P)H-dependent flavin oxidoreductase n=1 Tax=Georgenia sp. Z1491 TaxID=3416707 RepID=UPI003CFAC4E6